MRICSIIGLLVLSIAPAAASEAGGAAGRALEEVAFGDIDALIASSEGLVFVDLYADW